MDTKNNHRNKKAFTFIEVMYVLALSAFFTYSAIFIPANLMKDYKSYQNLSTEIEEFILVKKTIEKDLQGMRIKELDNNKLLIGNTTYTFTETGLYRNTGGDDVQLTSQQVNFKITKDGQDKTFNIYNDDFNFNYNIYNTSYHVKRGV